MNTLIDLENVSIKFRIYHNPIPSLKESLVNRISGKKNRDDYTEFYGLNKITLSIKPGERLGIIGMNGAGKSTLLKTIAGIYAPHQGHVRVQGRITPLMELGAGFDAEQTGRENIYLNGALLGFSPVEMKEKEEQSKNKKADLHKNETKPSLPLEKYVGDYESLILGEARVAVSLSGSGFHIQLQVNETFSGTLEHWHYDTFLCKWDNPVFGESIIPFITDGQGQVVEFRVKIREDWIDPMEHVFKIKNARKK